MGISYTDFWDTLCINKSETLFIETSVGGILKTLKGIRKKKLTIIFQRNLQEDQHQVLFMNTEYVHEDQENRHLHRNSCKLFFVLEDTAAFHCT